MVTDVDKNGDGVVSFDEFADKIHDVITKLKNAGPNQKKDGGQRGGANHWESLSLLITKYTNEAQVKPQASSRKREMLMSKKKKELRTNIKEKSSQHNAMVAHFNLRRLSVEVDPDEMEQAMKAMAEKESKQLNHRLKRPMHPHSTFRRLWEIMILVLVLFQAVYIPYTVSFRVIHKTGSSWWR